MFFNWELNLRPAGWDSLLLRLNKLCRSKEVSLVQWSQTNLVPEDYLGDFLPRPFSYFTISFGFATIYYIIYWPRVRCLPTHEKPTRPLPTTSYGSQRFPRLDKSPTTATKSRRSSRRLWLKQIDSRWKMIRLIARDWIRSLQLKTTTATKNLKVKVWYSLTSEAQTTMITSC